MSASDSEVASMEDSRVVEEEDSSLIDASASSTVIHPMSAIFETTVRPDFTGESILESKAISMASNDCSSAASSPAEASPAMAAETSTSIFEKTLDKSPTTSETAAASDSLKCTRVSIINISDVPSWSSELPSTTFGSPELKEDFPPTLTFKGVSVTLENNTIWKQFHQCGTEMILSKQGRRMFPYCRYRLSGLDPERLYTLVLSIVPADQFKYRWNTSKWGVNGMTEHQTQGLIRAFSHHYSPCRGSEWMSCLVSFYKLKLTNNFQDQDGHIVLHSMHRYIPRLHVIPLPDGNAPTVDKPVVVGPECVTFTFPQTEFMAVTTYQNFRITQLKINHNPFAKSFREHGSNPFLQKILTPAVNTDTEPGVFKPADLSEHKEETVDLSTTNQNSAAAAPSSSVQETKLVLKPIMSNPSATGDSYVPCIRGKHALGELVLVNKHLDNKPKEVNCIGGTPDVQQGLTMSKASVTPSSSTSTLRTTRRYRRRRKNGNRRWRLTYRPRTWKTATAAAPSPKVTPSPSLTVAMQPELDDIEGLLFVSFTTKEALDVHVRKMPVNISSLQSPVTSTRPTPSNEIVEVYPQTVEEETTGLEQMLLNDLKALRHRQVIHPVLQEVGLKLSALDPSTPIDLNYLGVHLPLPSLPEQSSSPAGPPADNGLPFISRTGKTSDMTKIKGWKNKFIKSHEASASSCEETQKKLSAFWSIMLDEYLESEAQQISERADAFSTNPEGSVAYQLPAKGSSYVKTLDSVLKHRSAASSIAVAANRPCPLSRKPLLRSFLMSSASPLASPEPPGPSRDQSTSTLTRLGAAASGFSYNADVSQRLSDSQTEAAKKPEVSFSHKQLMAYKSLGLSKVQLKLLWMEIRALNQGLSRTQLTSERLKMALTVVLTKQTLASQMLKVPPLPVTEVGPGCGQDFCRLGCVCSSLQLLDRGPVHCRQPECMFDCNCSNTLTNTEHKAQPHQGFNAKKLWNRNVYDNDSEPLYVPPNAPSLPPPKVTKSSVPYSAPTIREEDKDPVYKYLESLMTCARVRDFNSQPPPEVSFDTDIATAISKMSNTTEPQNVAQDVPEKEDSTVLMDQKSEEKPPQENTFNERDAKKQIEIQLLCQWKKDRKKILEGLYARLNKNRLHQRFYIGRYCINPVAKVILRKPSGSLVSYRVQISKPSKVSDCEEEESENDEYNYDGNSEAVEDEPLEAPERWYGATPFLSGVVPAGKLRANKKPAFVKASGLIQVNAKYYNHARLLLGNMGSLHPANRLAAHVTGRLRLPSGIPEAVSQMQEPPQKTDAAGSPRVKVLLLPTQTTSQPSNSVTKGFINLQQLPQNSFTLNPVQLLVPIQKSSSSSPVSLTVSPSLKNPSFLEQSGTYSFRIFPPSNQVSGDQNPPGVVLPGGFTLIELPKPGADGASQPAKPPNSAGPENTGDTPPQKKDAVSNLSHLAGEWVGFDTLGKVKDILNSKRGESSSSGLTSDDKVPSDENNEEDNNQTQEESNFDLLSDELSSDFSDDEELEDYDETIDIETVEEEKQGEAIAKLREDALSGVQQIRDSSGDSGPLKEPRKNESCLFKIKAMRRNHRALEKLRRCEQKILFSKLQEVLRSNPKTPRLHVLSRAVREIQNLKATSKDLEQQTTQLIQQQSVYVKRLSQLSGKSESLIQNKLQEIFNRVKQREKNMKWRPFFSQLLETKAALLQATAPKSHLQSSLLRQHNNPPPPQADLSNTAQSNLQMLLTLLHPTKNQQKSSDQHSENTSTTQAETPLHQKVTTSSSQMENQQSEPGASAQVCQPPSKSNTSQEASGDPEQATTSSSQTEDPLSSDKTPNQVIASQNGPTSGSSIPQNTNVAMSLAALPLPLIRSKSGRIILPSSLKPLGHGFYTLMVMEPKQKEAEDEVSSPANVQPPDGDLSKSLEKTISSADQPPDLENKHVTEDKASRSESDPKSSAGITPVAELSFSNQSIAGPSLDLKATEKNQEMSTGVSLSKAPASARLCFNPVSPPPPPVHSEPDPSPPVEGWHRNRHFKNQDPPVGAVTKEAVVEEPKISGGDVKIPQLIIQMQSDTEVSNNKAKGASREAADERAPIKRGRGRPRKKKLASQRSPPAKRAAKSPSISKDDSPVRFSISSFKSPNSANSQRDVYVSRPLTRASLGKDFPSAKKRSWIDVEKELDPDLEYA